MLTLLSMRAKVINRMLYEGSLMRHSVFSRQIHRSSLLVLAVSAFAVSEELAAECRYGAGEPYSEGALVCQECTVMVCRSSVWQSTGRLCAGCSGMEPRPPAATVTVYAGEYGIGGQCVLNVVDKANNECRNRIACTAEVNGRWAGGDPCPGRLKSMTILYRCIRNGEAVPGSDRRVSGGEGAVLQLDCSTF